MSDQMMGILTKISGDLGEMRAEVRNYAQQLNAHIADDEALGSRVTAIEMHQATQAGKATVWSMVGAAVGSALGAAAAFLGVRHG